VTPPGGVLNDRYNPGCVTFEDVRNHLPEAHMKKRIHLPPTVKRTTRLKPGKGWRLVNAARTGSLKGALVTTYNEAGERYVIFRLRD
jgi:hypothetical protein